MTRLTLAFAAMFLTVEPWAVIAAIILGLFWLLSNLRSPAK